MTTTTLLLKNFKWQFIRHLKPTVPASMVATLFSMWHFYLVVHFTYFDVAVVVRCFGSKNDMKQTLLKLAHTRNTSILGWFVGWAMFVVWLLYCFIVVAINLMDWENTIWPVVSNFFFFFFSFWPSHHSFARHFYWFINLVSRWNGKNWWPQGDSHR